MNENITAKNLLEKLKVKNKKEDGGLLEQKISVPTFIAESKIPSLEPGKYLLMPPQLGSSLSVRWTLDQCNSSLYLAFYK